MVVTYEQNLELAKLAEVTERYADMLKTMNEVAKMSGDMSVEERNLLSTAYKHEVGCRRNSWRILTETEQREGEDDASVQEAIDLLKKRIEKETVDICKQAFEVLDEHRIPKAQTPESRVFFHKMKADYKRYEAEVTSGDVRSKAADESLIAYKTALSIAEKELPPANAIRLGLALNFSVFYYEILESKQSARRLAESALEEASTEVKDLSDENYKESSLIVRLLRDNLTLWNSQAEDETDDIQHTTIQ